MTPEQGLIYLATRCVCVSERSAFTYNGGTPFAVTSRVSHHDPACPACAEALADPDIEPLLDGSDEGCTQTDEKAKGQLPLPGSRTHRYDFAELRCIETSSIGRRVRSGFYDGARAMWPDEVPE